MKAGLARARSNGKRLGRPRVSKETEGRIHRLRAQPGLHFSFRQIAVADQAPAAGLVRGIGVPDDLSVIDIMCFGPPLKPPYTRWKKDLAMIHSRDRFDMSKYQSPAEIDDWIRNTRHKVMYRDRAKID